MLTHAARRAQVRETFRHALDIARKRTVDFITIGGDLWEDENVVADTGLSVARGARRNRCMPAFVEYISEYGY